MEKQTKSLDCGRHFDFQGGGRVAKYRSFCSQNIFRKSHGSVFVNSMRFRSGVQKIGLRGTFTPPYYHMRVEQAQFIICLEWTTQILISLPRLNAWCNIFDRVHGKRRNHILSVFFANGEIRVVPDVFFCIKCHNIRPRVSYFANERIWFDLLRYARQASLASRPTTNRIQDLHACSQVQTKRGADLPRRDAASCDPFLEIQTAFRVRENVRFRNSQDTICSFGPTKFFCVRSNTLEQSAVYC